MLRLTDRQTSYNLEMQLRHDETTSDGGYLKHVKDPKISVSLTTEKDYQS